MREDKAVTAGRRRASGLGRATADRPLIRGHTVVVIDLPSAAAKVGRASGLEFVAADLCDPNAVEEAIAHAATLGPIRVGVSCAGVGVPQRIARKGVPMAL